MSLVRIEMIGIEPLQADIERIRSEASFRWPKEILDGAAEMMRDEVKNMAPKGPTGELANSVEIEETKDGRTVVVKAKHGKFVNDGTKASEGRYIPGIGKRYINEPGHLAGRYAKRIGMRPGVSKTLEYYEHTERVFEFRSTTGERLRVAGMFIPKGVKDPVGGGRGKPTIRIAALSRQATGRRSGMLRLQVHEYMHAVRRENIQRKQPGAWRGLGNEEISESAENMALEIGMHPGTPPTYFLDKAVERVRGRILGYVSRKVYEFLLKKR